MTYIYAFIFCGTVCGLSQAVLEKTKFTPGHMNTILVIFGCILSGLGIYDKLISIFKAGATIPIVNFGHLLVVGASEGYKVSGFIGLFKGVFTNCGGCLSVAIASAFVVTLLFKIKH
jgi:stage V sporulation protein AE